MTRFPILRSRQATHRNVELTFQRYSSGIDKVNCDYKGCQEGGGSHHRINGKNDESFLRFSDGIGISLT